MLQQQMQPGYEGWQKKAAWFLSSQTVSLFGSSIVQFAIIWHITLSTTSGVMITISSLCSFLPQILISLFAGVWADRYSRKVLIMAADGMIAFVTLILAVIYLSGYRELWLLFLVSGIRSAGAGIQTPAVSAIIPQIVPQEKLMRMNGVNGTIQSLTMLVSPAISGAVLSLAGLEATFFIDVVTAAAAILIMSRLKVAKLERTEETVGGAMGELKDGLRYTWNHRFIRALLAFYAVLMFLVTPAALLTPLMTARSFGDDVWRLTANEVVWSLGAMLGGILMASWGGFQNRVRTIAFGTAAFGVFTALIGCSTQFIFYLCMLFITGVFMPMISSPSMVLLQEHVEPLKQGRVFSLVQIVGSGCVPLGMAVFGPLADAVKIEWLLIATGILMTALGFAILRDRNLKQAGEPVNRQI